MGGQEVDSLAHPISTSCGVRLDPVAYVLDRIAVLGLSDSEVGQLTELGETLAEQNRPAGERWWNLAGRVGIAPERRAILAELRGNYRAALAEAASILGAERWELIMRPPPRGDPLVRCLCRSVLAILAS